MALLMLLVFTAPMASRAVEVRTVALAGQPAPGVEATFSVFQNTPSINNEGHVAFSAHFNVAGTPSWAAEPGVFTEAEGQGLRLIARRGDLAPGIADVEFATFDGLPGAPSAKLFGSPVIDSLDQVTVEAYLQFGGTTANNDNALFAFRDGASTLIAREGDPAPDAGGLLYGAPVHPSIGDETFSPTASQAGHRVFSSYLETSAGEALRGGLYMQSGQNTSLVAQTGDHAPGLGQGVLLESLFIKGSAFKQVVNKHGHTAFVSEVDGPGINGGNDSALFTQTGGAGLRLAAQEGDPAPGVGEGSVVSGFYPPSLNSRGELVYMIDYLDVENAQHRAIYKESVSAGLELIAYSGPKQDNDDTLKSGGIDNFGVLPLVNSSGQVAFRRPRGQVMLTDTDGVLRLAVERLSQPIGAEEGALFDGVRNNSLSLNAAGQVAFLGSLEGPGISGDNFIGLFGTDVNGRLHLIAQAGELFDVSDESSTPDLRTIDEIGFVGLTGNDDGRRSAFNDLGQVAFVATFTDGSAGVFVATLPVPEPSELVTVVIALAAIARARNTPR